MNIESILNKINLFDELVVNSGFRRDINDYIQAIQQPQNQNLVFMKGISERIQNVLLNFENNSLPSELKHILKDTEPFTAQDFLSDLINLNANLEIDGSSFFQKFNTILNSLGSAIDQNIGEIKTIKKIFSKYISDKNELNTKEDQGLVSLVFKDIKSTGTLKEFSRVLNKWNQTLSVFHQLMKSESPEDISLVEVQNGSIDVIFNINLDVALDLTDVINTGLKMYGAYLIYKTRLAQEAIASFTLFKGNAELVDLEIKKEKLMLSHIKISIKDRILVLHKEHVKTDTNINQTAVEKKADEVSSVITDHIIKGNEVKLLTPPKPKEDTDSKETSESINLPAELRENTALVRENSKKLLPEDRTLLLETYALKDDETPRK